MASRKSRSVPKGVFGCSKLAKIAKNFCGNNSVVWVNEAIKINFKPVYYFFTKKFYTYKKRKRVQKAQKAQSTKSTKRKQTIFVPLKDCCLCCLLFAYFCFVSLLLLVSVFCVCRIFS